MHNDSKILKDPDERLRVRSTEVRDFQEAKKIANELLSVVKSVARFWKLWLGFAAPQIGYNERIIVLRDGIKKYRLMVNPEILETKWPFIFVGRCYSLKGLYIMKGYLWTKVKYQDLEENYHEKVFGGPNAIGHEIDHINGVLSSDIGKRIF
jgi:peptide deformylase